MTREEAIKTLTFLKAAYPRFYADLSKQEAEGAINLWTMMLADYQYPVVQVAVQQYVATSQYPPTIAEIRRALVGAVQGPGTSPDEAWGQVQKAIRRFGYSRQEEALASMDKVTAGIVRNMGWMNLCMSENQMADRAHFLKLYQAAAEEEKRNQVIPLELHRRARILQDKHKEQILSLADKMTM
ncbi:replicative helicase loader/inhibitor [Anaerotalea alkaliphila]|uniref:Replicative helicase inhibitor G39P N-terminal domain-containing protein n=1 Tax=Anaerotalea alkaliphila TaxID=2662126 RepID=A0A7X5HXN4_9FIRM|nr:replicative helicase loader/inhibitor [Anaerotalea alkaliphila]NDL68496.1 hypothetical protein [Anaerotalea alkaliphila]